MTICGEDNPHLTRHWQRLPWVWRTEEMLTIGELFFFFFFEKLMYFFPTVTTSASQPSDGDLLEEKVALT